MNPYLHQHLYTSISRNTAGKWWKCDPISEHPTPELVTWVGHELGGLASHQCRWAGVVWAPRCRDLRDGLLAGVGCSSLTLCFSWTVTLIILGLGFLRARVLRLCCTTGGLLVLQDVGTMKSLHWRCEMWFNCVERKRSAKLLWSVTAPCTFAAAPSFQACLRVFIYTFCLCVCIYVYVCMCADMYICICMHVCVFVPLCVYTRVYVYVYVCLCIDCGSWYQCFSLWTVSCMRMCFHVHMYAYACVCRYICMCIFYCECCMHFTGVLGTSA